jgi:hypothetical protein
MENDSTVKEDIIEEWDAITVEEIRKRIKEMPERCKLLISNAIKSSKW